MIVNPNSVSFEEIYTDILNHILAKPEYQKWRDFYTGSASSVIIEVMAGVMAYIQYAIIANRRETYLLYATKRASAVANAETLGYSAFRGHNPYLTMTVTPQVTVILPKFTSLGIYDEYEYILAETTPLVTGIETTLNVIIGLVKEEELIVQSSELQIFRFSSRNVSEDIKLQLKKPNGSFVDMNWYKELDPFSYFTDSEYYWVIANSLGAVDAMYLNNPTGDFTGQRYDAGDILKLIYVELAELIFDGSNTPTQIFDDEDTLIAIIESIAVSSAYLAPEALSSIQVNAPVAHETSHLVRGRDDYKKEMKNVITSISGKQCVDTNGTNISPAVVGLSYVMEDETNLTAPQKANVISKLSCYRPFGIEPPVIFDSVFEELRFDVVLNLLPSYTGLTTAQVQTTILTILSAYEKKLELTIDEDDFRIIEKALESLAYVRTARITVTTPVAPPYTLAWNHYYRLLTPTITLRT